MDLELLRRARCFPVRHHSPRSAQALGALLEQVQPQLVLVEGPQDATPLIDILVDPATEPPVAILGYRTDGQPSSALWPFATYSPEYTALHWARRLGRPARFIDLPTGRALAVPEEARRRLWDEASDGGECDAGGDIGQQEPHPLSRLAAGQGFRSFEELWEARFEVPGHSSDEFARLAAAFAGWSRTLDPCPLDRFRDAFMAAAVCDAVGTDGVAPERLLVVMGAAHVAAFHEGEIEPQALAGLPEPVATELTIIPFSFPRLAEQLGYGAGNRAPRFYQRAHDAGCDFRRASLEVLLDLAEHLRLRGFSASMADTIEAYRLALRLAELRDKARPGLDEVREGAVACLFRGDTSLVDELLWPAVVGKRVGRVASRIGRNSLQQEFWHEVRTRRLPEHDSPEAFTLQLHNEVEIDTSIFLHRLRVADIPYALFLGSRSTRGGAREEEPGGVQALQRVREEWEAQWTPATDVALAESIALGETLAMVATCRLDERLTAATTTGEAARVLLEAVVASCPRPVTQALAACDRFAARDDDLPSLAGACQALSGLVSFGTSRTSGSDGDEAVQRLCMKTYNRAMVRVDDACVVGDDGLAAMQQALCALHEVALSQELVDRAAWVRAAESIARSYSVNPVLAGLVTGLLVLAQILDEQELAVLIEQRLSDVSEPGRAAAFLDGFLEVNALVLVRNREVTRLLDEFLAGLDGEAFRQSLPVLRRAFSRLGATERRYLLENVVSLRGLGKAETEVSELLSRSDDEALQALDDQVSDALDDLDDLL